ncbi:MAG: riboflavin biosynthesis protein RibF [Myxococcales bacterium]|nr:riboflavin biosynthesis protein RibF [Myxococcales bacterium]
MKVFHSISEAAGLRGCAASLGNFDGVHLGHRALFAEAARHARPVAITFHPHPGKVLQPELAPKLITLLPRKLELFEEAGLHAAVVQPFTLEYAHTPASAFEASVLDQLGASHLVIGSDFTYGAGRAGTVETLEKAVRSRGAELHLVPPVTVDGVVVSSTKVREYVLEGRVSAAHRLLGRYFDLDGTVVPGQGRGRTIGIPTANVDTASELRPAPGVYAVRVAKKGGPPLLGSEGGWVGGAANIGVKPTFGGTEVTVEVHLIDWSGDLYGAELRVQFIERLRSEQRFASAAELAGQIRRDIEEARSAIARATE